MANVAKPEKPARRDQHVGDYDSLFWIIESDPLLRNTITAVIVLDESPDRAVVLDRLERASRVAPGFRHRLVTPPLRLANPRWVVDPDFELSYHVRWIGAPREKTLASVFEFARTATVSGFDRARPLWTYTIVDGLEGGRAAVIVMLHHVLTDGVGGLGLLSLTMDLSPEPTPQGPMPPLPTDEPMAQKDLAIDAIETNRDRMLDLMRKTGAGALRTAPGLLKNPGSAVPKAARNAKGLGRLFTPPGKPLSPIMTARRGWSHFATVEGDLAAMRRAAKKRHVTVNDAFVAAVGHGFARYHEKMDAPVDKLRVTMAVNTRKPGDPPFGNKAYGGNFVMPVGTDDPAGYMATYHKIVGQLREDVSQPWSRAAGTIANALGPLASSFVGTMMKNCDLLMSNVPGVDMPLWFAGARVRDIYGFGPVMGTAANATLLSYNGTAYIGLNIDAAAVPEIDVLADCVREGLDAVVALAAK